MKLTFLAYTNYAAHSAATVETWADEYQLTCPSVGDEVDLRDGRYIVRHRIFSRHPISAEEEVRLFCHKRSMA